MFTHIAYDDEILGGKPHIIGTRLSIEFILELVATGATRDDMLKAYPQLTIEAIEEALRYAAQFYTVVTRVLNKNESLYKKLS